jgi:tRNA (guanine-N7-)-methyltransferase
MNSNKINLKQLPQLLPHSINWGQFFNNQNPTDLEIGCGRTHFFFDRAHNLPDRNIIGIEWKYEFIEQGQRRIIREGLTNAALFHGNAWLLVPLLFKAQSISQVIVNFPDPWWKARHKKRLVLNEVFLCALKTRMKPDGFILLQTDVAELFTFYQELLGLNGFRFDSSIPTETIIAHTKAQTHREKKCLAQGLPIYRGIFNNV